MPFQATFWVQLRDLFILVSVLSNVGYRFLLEVECRSLTTRIQNKVYWISDPHKYKDQDPTFKRFSKQIQSHRADKCWATELATNEPAICVHFWTDNQRTCSKIE